MRGEGEGDEGGGGGGGGGGGSDSDSDSGGAATSLGTDAPTAPTLINTSAAGGWLNSTLAITGKIFLGILIVTSVTGSSADSAKIKGAVVGVGSLVTLETEGNDGSAITAETATSSTNGIVSET